jgi:glycosyltransferase involved in cell wall biosynthesis
MRLAFVLCGGLNGVSGGFLYDRRLIAELRAAGAKVDVFELPWWRYELQLMQNLLPWEFPARGYDAVIEDELCHPAVFARNRRLRRGAPVISLVHNLASEQPATRRRGLVRACEQRYFKAVDGVVAVCYDTLAAVRRCGGNEVTGVVAPPGRDHVPAGIADERNFDGPMHLAFVGQLAPHKGLHRLISVLARVPADVTLEVAGAVGDPEYVAEFRRNVVRVGVAARVRVHGLLAPLALAALLARCHAFVMPSDREAYPLAALEAMAAGLPALLTRAGGTGEVIGGSDAGLLLDPDDDHAWIDAITRLHRDRARLRHMSQAARARYLSHGTWADTARVVLRFVRATVAAAPPSHFFTRRWVGA